MFTFQNQYLLGVSDMRCAFRTAFSRDELAVAEAVIMFRCLLKYLAALPDNYESSAAQGGQRNADTAYQTTADIYTHLDYRDKLDTASAAASMVTSIMQHNA